jgi:hypothetical protein
MEEILLLGLKDKQVGLVDAMELRGDRQADERNPRATYHFGTITSLMPFEGVSSLNSLLEAE